MEKGYIIRRETKEDYFAVENLVRESFWNVYRPGCLEHYVIHCLRDDPDFAPELATPTLTVTSSAQASILRCLTASLSVRLYL